MAVIAMIIYYILGRLGLFIKANRFVSSVKDVFNEEDKKSNNDKEND
ncbi:hypothetical protein [Peribacillus asahii]